MVQDEAVHTTISWHTTSDQAQANSLVHLESLMTASPRRQSTRNTRGVAPKRVTYEVI